MRVGLANLTGNPARPETERRLRRGPRLPRDGARQWGARSRRVRGGSRTRRRSGGGSAWGRWGGWGRSVFLGVGSGDLDVVGGAAYVDAVAGAFLGGVEDVEDQVGGDGDAGFGAGQEVAGGGGFGVGGAVGGEFGDVGGVLGGDAVAGGQVVVDPG